MDGEKVRAVQDEAIKVSRAESLQNLGAVVKDSGLFPESDEK